MTQQNNALAAKMKALLTCVTNIQEAIGEGSEGPVAPADMKEFRSFVDYHKKNLPTNNNPNRQQIMNILSDFNQLVFDKHHHLESDNVQNSQLIGDVISNLQALIKNLSSGSSQNKAA